LDGTKQNIIPTILKVGKQLDQMLQQKHQQYTIGTAQLGYPSSFFLNLDCFIKTLYKVLYKDL
jgi:hypothetical protein